MIDKLYLIREIVAHDHEVCNENLENPRKPTTQKLIEESQEKTMKIIDRVIKSELDAMRKGGRNER